MNTKEKQYIEYIYKVIKKWQPRLKLDHFTMRVDKTQEEHYMSCQYRFPYLDGIILYSNASMLDWKKEKNEHHERKIVHEMCHLITDPLYTKATTLFISKSEVEDERERLTDHIAVMMVKAFE